MKFNFVNIERILKLIIVITAGFMLGFSINVWIKDAIETRRWHKEMVEMGERGISETTRSINAVEKDTVKEK